MGRDGAELTEEQLCRSCLDKLPHFAVPRHIEFRSELPRNAARQGAQAAIA